MVLLPNLRNSDLLDAMDLCFEKQVANTAPKVSSSWREGYTAWAQLCHPDIHQPFPRPCEIGLITCQTGPHTPAPWATSSAPAPHGRTSPVVLLLLIRTLAETVQVVQSRETYLNVMPGKKHAETPTAADRPSDRAQPFGKPPGCCNWCSSCWIWYADFLQNPDHITNTLLPELFFFF